MPPKNNYNAKFNNGSDSQKYAYNSFMNKNAQNSKNVTLNNSKNNQSLPVDKLKNMACFIAEKISRKQDWNDNDSQMGAKKLQKQIKKYDWLPALEEWLGFSLREATDENTIDEGFIILMDWAFYKNGVDTYQSTRYTGYKDRDEI